MEIAFTARHFELTSHMKEHVARKLSKLDGMVDRVIEARVILTVENYRHIAEVKFSMRGHDFVATGEASEMTAAVDQVADKLERQLRRSKERRVRRRRDGRSQPQPVALAAPVVSVDEGATDAPEMPPLTRADQDATPPMSVEEAVERLDEEGGEYLVFSNTNTQNLTVVYRREDGSYGLIEPSVQGG